MRLRNGNGIPWWFAIGIVVVLIIIMMVAYYA